MYGPGNPPKAWKPKAVSSVITGPPTYDVRKVKW